MLCSPHLAASLHHHLASGRVLSLPGWALLPWLHPNLLPTHPGLFHGPEGLQGNRFIPCLEKPLVLSSEFSLAITDISRRGWCGWWPLTMLLLLYGPNKRGWGGCAPSRGSAPRAGSAHLPGLETGAVFGGHASGRRSWCSTSQPGAVSPGHKMK